MEAPTHQLWQVRRASVHPATFVQKLRGTTVSNPSPFVGVQLASPLDRGRPLLAQPNRQRPGQRRRSGCRILSSDEAGREKAGPACFSVVEIVRETFAALRAIPAPELPHPTARLFRMTG